MDRVSVVPAYPKVTSDGKLRLWSERNKDWWIEEKLDGSQLSVYVRDDRKLGFQNRGRELNQEAPGWVFEAAMGALSSLRDKFNPAYVYHGECIVRPKHNVVRYGRVPRFYFVLFDVQDRDTRQAMDRNAMEMEAHRIGIECTPVLYRNTDPAVQPGAMADALIEAMIPGCSLLGGDDKPEGVVIKHHQYVKRDKPAQTKIKVVREEFKEEHRRPTTAKTKHVFDPEASLDRIMSFFPVDARWNKATQRLRDAGTITGDPENEERERGAIREEARRDFKDECKETLKALLWAEFGQHLTQRITKEK